VDKTIKLFMFRKLSLVKREMLKLATLNDVRRRRTPNL